MSGLGVGASGKNWYGFELSFYEAVSTEVSILLKIFIIDYF